MNTLPNGCYCSDIRITKSKRTGNWRIYYRFYDPAYKKPNGKIKPFDVVIKQGINHIADLRERAAMAKRMIDDEWQVLQSGYNPITKTIPAQFDQDYEIHPETPFIHALTKAMEKVTVGHRTRIGIKSVVKGVEAAALQLRYAGMAIKDVSRRHIKMILDQCGRNSSRWSNGRYNLYRAYLLTLFKELVELEAVTGNPVRDISKKPVVKKIKKVLTDEERIAISKHLPNADYRYWMFINLFFHSGGRKTELFQLKPGMVDLDRQAYRCIINKRKVRVEVERTIKSVAVPYWKYFLEGCSGEQFIFGAYYQPASRPMSTDGPTRHWNKYVKADPKDGGLGIDVDLYALKHLNTTEVVDQLNEQAAAALNAHTSTAMVVNIYDVRQKDRQHEKLKNLANEFVPKAATPGTA